MKYLKISIIAVAASLTLFSCKSQYDALLQSSDVDAKFKAAMNYFNNRKYSKAASLFESMAVLASGTAKDDSVQYYWGLSNYKYKDYVTAETNFSKFVENYPLSKFAPEASFLRLDCLYRSTLRYELDPTPTYNAINAINQYLHDYPSTDRAAECMGMLSDLNARLDRKAFEGARLYYKMEDYKAARVAFKNILKDDADNIYREDILYYIAMSSYKYAYLSVPSKQKERYLAFEDDYFNFISEIDESPYTRQLNALYRRAQKALGKYTGEDETDNMKDKDFEKERKVLKQSGKGSGI